MNHFHFGSLIMDNPELDGSLQSGKFHLKCTLEMERAESFGRVVTEARSQHSCPCKADPRTRTLLGRRARRVRAPNRKRNYTISTRPSHEPPAELGLTRTSCEGERRLA